jgi:predicted transcriptional regulator
MQSRLEDKTQSSPEVQVVAQIVAAYVRGNEVPATVVPQLIQTVHASLAGAGNGWATDGQRPAIAIEQSVMPDYIVCLEDGRALKMLKRYLMATYGMTPDQYRDKWRLPPEYPMVAPNYVRLRSEFAKRIGLGKRTSKKGTRRAAKR